MRKQRKFEHRKVYDTCILCGQKDGECEPGISNPKELIRTGVLMGLFDSGFLPEEDFLTEAYGISAIIERYWNSKIIFLVNDEVVLDDAYQALHTMTTTSERGKIEYVKNPRNVETISFALRSVGCSFENGEHFASWKIEEKIQEVADVLRRRRRAAGA